MKKKRNWIRQITISAAAIMLAAAMGGKAHAGTITFDGLPAGVFTSFTEGAFTVTALPGNPGDHPTIVNVGGADQNVVGDGNIFYSYGTAFVITETDGGLFSLNSIDVADLQNDRTVQSWHCGSGSRI